MQPLAGDAERLPAGGQDAQFGGPQQQVFGELGDVVHEVLAVVQHQQHGAGRDSGDQSLGGVQGVLPGAVLGAQHQLAAAHRGEHGGRQGSGVGKRRELGEPDRVRAERGDRLPGQAGLAGPARPGERDQPGVVEYGVQPAQVGVPADEAAQPRTWAAESSDTGRGIQRLAGMALGLGLARAGSDGIRDSP